MLQVPDTSAAPKSIKAQEECLLTEWQEIYPDVSPVPPAALYPSSLCQRTKCLYTFYPPGALGLLQNSRGSIGQHLAPQDNIRRVRILSEVVTDAPDTRDE